MTNDFCCVLLFSHLSDFIVLWIGKHFANTLIKKDQSLIVVTAVKTDFIPETRIKGLYIETSV